MEAPAGYSRDFVSRFRLDLVSYITDNVSYITDNVSFFGPGLGLVAVSLILFRRAQSKNHSWHGRIIHGIMTMATRDMRRKFTRRGVEGRSILMNTDNMQVIMRSLGHTTKTKHLWDTHQSADGIRGTPPAGLVGCLPRK